MAKTGILTRFRNLVGLNLISEPRKEMGLAKPGRKRKGRIGSRLIRPYVFRYKMSLDNLASAIAEAEDPKRPRREPLYDLYEQSADDAQASSQMQTRTMKALGERFVMIDPAGKIGERFNEEAAAELYAPWFYNFLTHAMGSKYWGHSLIELVRNEDKLETYLIPRRHVRPETGEILIQQEDETGIPYRGRNLGTHLVEIGEPYDLGLLKRVTKYVIIKTFSLSDWAAHSEKFGMPAVVVKTASTDEKEIDAKAEMARNFGRNSWMVLDDEDEVSFQESHMTNPHMLYEKLAERMDMYISKLLSGQTMTADAGGSLAQAKVHERILDEITEADLRWLGFQVNHCLFPVLEDMGLSVGGLRFEWARLTVEHEEAAREERMGGAAGKYSSQGQRQKGEDPEPKDEAQLKKKSPVILRPPLKRP